MSKKKEHALRCYERKNKLWITGNEADAYTDIFLSKQDGLALYVSGNDVHIKQGYEGSLKLNDKPVAQHHIVLRDGDILSLDTYSIVFYKEWIEITGLRDEDEVRLLPVDDSDGRFSDYPFYKRSPRVIYRIENETIQVKAPPEKSVMSKGGIAQLLVPTLSTLAFTVLMGFMLKRGAYIYMSIGMTVITMIFSVKNFIAQSKEIRQTNRKREIVYKEYLLSTRSDIRMRRAREKEALNYLYPDADSLAQMIEGCGGYTGGRQGNHRLYERSFGDDDFLEVTLGFFKGKSAVMVSYEKDGLDLLEDELKDMAKDVRDEYAKVDDMPLAVNLRQEHMGLVGDKDNIHMQLKYLLMQLTFFHSYHDLQIIFVHHEAYRERFYYTRWYPHLSVRAINMTGDIYTEQARDQVFGSLQQMLKERRQRQAEEQQEVTFSPHILFIIDEPELIQNHPIMEYLQGKENNLGFSFIYTTNQRENLPENIKTVCLLENKEDGRLLLNAGRRVNRTFTLEQTDFADSEEQARTIGALEHVLGMKSHIPESITFFEMFGIDHPEQLLVEQRWRENQSHKSLAVPLGVRAKDDFVELNLHEKAHGPHGLVAGTTGSGKSEIVQSYILSLAVNFHPYEVGFLLIDYKGGGMANLFRKLPHLLGTITNLDKAESMRAMASIKSELARRQRIFGEANVNHINGYNKLFKLGKVREPLPHLFLISDEFAELKKEQPDFMSELVSAARIGRSLGIHLILATQKPSGVVDDQIWTNSKFKLCLKVQNAGDSKEMLRTADAANITQAGRAYLQVGNNEIYELFQSAWSGAAYQPEQTEEDKEDDRVYLLNELGQGMLVNQDLSGPSDSNQIKETQLDVVVRHVSEVYQRETNEDAIEVKKPWLPSLPDMMISPYTGEAADSAKFTDLNVSLALGMIDIPEEQIQREYMLDFVSNGHFLYMASSGYGKSTVLGHIILGLSMQNSVQNLNIYIIDLGNSALIPYSNLPHVADYMGIDDAEKLDKFQRLINEEITRRKRLLAEQMVQNFNVYNQSGQEKLRAIVIVLDNYDVLGELGDAALAFIQKTAREGAGLGIYLVTTMTRENAMRNAVKGSFKEKIAGYNFSENEVMSLIGRSPLRLSEEKRGQALVKTENINTIQMYTPVSCENELIYNEEIKKKIAEVKGASSEKAAKPIPVLPENLHYDMLADYSDYTEEVTRIPVGLDIDSLDVKYLDLRTNHGLIIGGSGMGRTNMIKNTLRHLEGHRVFLFDSKSGDLMDWKAIPNIHYAGDKETTLKLLDVIKEEVLRRRTLLSERKDEGMKLKQFAETLEPVFIVIDIIQEFIEHLSGASGKEDILIEAAEAGLYLVASSDQKLRATSISRIPQLFLETQAGFVVGNIKDQSVYSANGIREENRRPEFGYYHYRGENSKVKVVCHV